MFKIGLTLLQESNKNDNTVVVCGHTNPSSYAIIVNKPLYKLNLNRQTVRQIGRQKDGQT